ncbi:cell division protein FtsQ/DivIB [Sphingosinicella rhizophila]|uniref:Cell division protein FtsQ n=1 Tax=Sphingosinicella rhizophila TaxID=3050082 RepID=A0ABU3Q407_9SPHN|nr:cell division protein FtsQ/DivIB [Sphingosinicella sp. GR2756]MDT9598047.1 cell division protein FtsQ/DivIB [Sphingosinicella sp. GR2756]
MTARIARGSSQRARPKQAARGRPGRKQASPDPLSDFVRRMSWWIFILMIVAVAIASIVAFRIPQMIGTAVGEEIGEAGFAVKRVEIKGLERMQRLPVYAVALDQDSMAMPLVDLEATRARLLRFGWVREARVSRRLPDTLVVDIIERKPAAIWQHNQHLNLIDSEGVVLEAVRLEAMPDLPLVIGPAANRHAAELARLVQMAPQLKPMMAGASWIGGRRWDIRFQSGEVLALPEGVAAQRALVHFARMDQATQLLGRGFVRFDMRIPGKFIVRVSKEPGSALPLMPSEPPAPPPAAQVAEPVGRDVVPDLKTTI